VSFVNEVHGQLKRFPLPSAYHNAVTMCHWPLTKKYLHGFVLRQQKSSEVKSLNVVHIYAILVGHV